MSIEPTLIWLGVHLYSLDHSFTKFEFCVFTLYCGFITARKRSLEQGNIFISVCQEFCSRGGACSGGCLLLGGGACSQGGACSWGASRPTPKGEIQGDQDQFPHPPPPTTTAAGGEYPTGMHSCSSYVKTLKQDNYNTFIFFSIFYTFHCFTFHFNVITTLKKNI